MADSVVRSYLSSLEIQCDVCGAMMASIDELRTHCLMMHYEQGQDKINTHTGCIYKNGSLMPEAVHFQKTSVFYFNQQHIWIYKNSF
uniref:C2H2-type domain-containing protein n=1 Tax=Ciona intestinalis TaxID=7719 RepID=H2XTI7_CIOIN